MISSMLEFMFVAVCAACVCLAFAFMYSRQKQADAPAVYLAPPAIMQASQSQIPLGPIAASTMSSTQAPVPPKAYSASLTATNCKDARPAANAVEETFRLYVQQRGREFVTHLKNSKHSTDPRAQSLIVSWSGLVHIFSAQTAQFNHVTGCFFMNPSAKNLTRARMNTKLLHEFAHSTCCGHEVKWQGTFKYFLGIATSELGWIVDVDCAICQKYGVCQKSDCPKCNWTADPSKCATPHYVNKTCTISCEE
jgi:hypothetical protein